MIKMVLGKVLAKMNIQRGASSPVIRTEEVDMAEYRIGIPYVGSKGKGYSELSIGQKKSN
ncbi:MAG: hypothetical protein KAR35_11515 [Candidatus Heimdallarchaeota archaeon]|nr:hypothetical protein [Candidatus Heimdallarchaeota archaeon]MCK5049989.1 hypothetical protein [Candidatus Heimdallarchaeota archaeon]